MNLNTGTLFLIGGGSITRGETNFIEAEILKSVNKTNPQILMINFANSIGKDSKYLEKFRCAYDIFEGYEITFDQLFYNESFDEEIVKMKFAVADIIYIGGGDTLQLLQAIKRSNLDKFIINAYLYDGKVIVGRSAGNIIFFEKFLSEKGKNTKEVGLFRGLGFLRGIGTAHLTESNEEEILGNFVQISGISGIGMDERSCILLKDGQYRILEGGTGGVYKYTPGTTITVVQLDNHNFSDINYLFY